MTKEEYKEHLKGVIHMVFCAEDKVCTDTIRQRLKARSITPDEYYGMIADEIIAKTSVPIWEEER